MTAHHKNEYQKILGYSFLVLVFAAVVSVIYLFQASKYPFGNPQSNNQPQKVSYNNEQYKFTFEYNKAYTLNQSGTEPNYLNPGGKNLVSVSLPKEKFEKTNLGSAWINVSVRDDATVAQCQNYVTSANRTKKMTQTFELDSGKYFADTFKGVAAGTVYDTNIYHILRGQTCYEITETVGIANIGNFEPGSVTEVVEADVWNLLNIVFGSLKFN